MVVVAVAVGVAGDIMTVINCSFCGKTPKEADRIIAGPFVGICAECVERSVEILKAGDRSPSEARDFNEEACPEWFAHHLEVGGPMITVILPTEIVTWADEKAELVNTRRHLCWAGNTAADLVAVGLPEPDEVRQRPPGNTDRAILYWEKMK